jgi:hypothetical protein
MKTDTFSDPLDRLVGAWTTEATHPAMPGVVVHGTSVFEWLEGRRFLTLRARNDHPDFPDALSIIGRMGHDRVDGGAGAARAAGAVPTDADASPLRMHYYDSRGVFRVCETRMDDTSWRVWRDAPGFSQRFTGLLSEDGDTILGRWELCRDDVHWADDLQITYRRQP